MWEGEQVVRTLRARGEVWQAAPGVVGLRGDVLALFHALESAVLRLAREETEDEWRVPSAMAWGTLERADYFASFPQWLTAASHLGGDEPLWERIATSARPADEACTALRGAAAALPPAVCYHVYAALADTIVRSPRLVTAQGTCWRHEGERLRPLERGWAFTMREVVCLGDARDTAEFRTRGIDGATALAGELGLRCSVVEASDPFFAPTSRGRALLQRIKALKHELILPIGRGRGIAAASFNHHEKFFGGAFDIRLPDGTAASSACVAFGLERWLLAFLAAHGPDVSGWPAVESLEVGAAAGGAA